jgi:O-antigen ligase
MKKNTLWGFLIMPLYIFTAIKGQSQFMTIVTILVCILFLSVSFGKKGSLYFLAFLLLIFIFSGFGEQIFNYISGLIADRENSNSFRFDKMQDSIQIFKDNILFGSGPNSEIFVSKSLASSENTYTQILAELGICGFSIFLALHLITIFRCLKYFKIYGIISREFIIMTILIIGFLGPILWTSGFFAPLIWISFYVLNVLLKNSTSFK